MDGCNVLNSLQGKRVANFLFDIPVSVKKEKSGDVATFSE